MNGPELKWLFATIVAPVAQPEQASRLKSATRDVNFLRSDSRCRRYVSVLSKRLVQGSCYWEVFELGAKGQGFVVVVDFQLTFSFLVEVEDCQHSFCSRLLSFNFQA